MSDLPDAVDQLTKRLQALEQRLESRLESLERRLDALEHPLAAHWPHPSPETGATPALAAAAAPPLPNPAACSRAGQGHAGHCRRLRVAGRGGNQFAAQAGGRLCRHCIRISVACVGGARARRPAASIHKLDLCRHFRADPCSHALGADPALQSSAGGDRSRRGLRLCACGVGACRIWPRQIWS